MKFEERWPNGCIPPFSDTRKFFLRLDSIHNCVECGDTTQWVYNLLLPICSDECFATIINKLAREYCTHITKSQGSRAYYDESITTKIAAETIGETKGT